MKATKIGKIKRTPEHKKWFNRKGYTMTGETLTLESDDGHYAVSYVVFKGKWTRYDTVRDCGEYYIFAGYSRYYRIDKYTLEVTEDVEDK